MLSQDLKAQVLKLTPSDHLAIISAIVDSLQDTPVAQTDRSSTIQRMKGLLKTEQLAPIDTEVAAILAERRVEK